MKPPNFKYFPAQSVDEAVTLLAEHGDEARVLAGGQSLVQWMNARLVAPRVLIDLNPIADLAYVRPENETLALGAMTRTATVEHDATVAESLPILAEAAARVGYVAVRNRGTVGGNLAHADPAANLPPVMLVLDAELVIRGSGGERTVAAADFFHGPHRTSLEPAELLTEIRLPLSSAGSAFLEVSPRGRGWGLVGVAAAIELDEGGNIADARLGLSGAAPAAIRAREAEDALREERPSEETWVEAAQAAVGVLDPPSDVHASADYRRHLAGVLVRRALTTATARVEGR